MFSPKSARVVLVVSLLSLWNPSPNRSNAALLPAVSYPAGAQPIGLAVGDLNNDGKLDLVTLNQKDTVSVLLGTGSGAFGPRTPLVGPHPLDAEYPGAVAIGDLNNDGNRDFVVAHRFSAYVRLGNGSGSFGPIINYPSSGGLGTEPRNVVLGDLNNDGKLDLLDTNLSCLGNGDGTFALAEPRGAVTPYDRRLADFNGDNKLDVTMGSYAPPVNPGVMLGDGDGTFSGGGYLTLFGETDATAIGVGDLNRDGFMDMVVGCAISGHVWVLLGAGNGSFTAPYGFVIGTGAVLDLAVGDVTNDGLLDVLTTDPNLSKLSVFPGDGTGRLGTRVDYATGTSPQRLAIADLNGDLAHDVIVVAMGGNVASVHMNSGGSVVNFTQSYFVPQAASLQTPSEGYDAIKYFRACPNNDGVSSLPNNARLKIVLRDAQGNPVAGIPASDICVAFNGGTAIQGFEGTGADSIIANSTYNVNPSCPDVRCIEADAPTDASGVTYITFTGTAPGAPGVGVRDSDRKWGHYDSNIPVQYGGANLDGRITSASPNGTYKLIIKSVDLTGGLGTQLNQGEIVTIADFNAVNAALNHSVSENPLYFWRDFDWNGVINTTDLNISMNHLNHHCQSPNTP